MIDTMAVNFQRKAMVRYLMDKLFGILFNCISNVSDSKCIFRNRMIQAIIETTTNGTEKDKNLSTLYQYIVYVIRFYYGLISILKPRKLTCPIVKVIALSRMCTRTSSQKQQNRYKVYLKYNL